MIATLNIFDSVEICVTDKYLQKNYYRTKIQDLGLNNIFYTMIPSSTSGRPVMFFKDQVYELYAKSAEGIILWEINYLGIEKIDGMSACKFKAIKGPIITQRREFFRQPVSVDVEFQITKSSTPFELTDLYSGRIIDLSGGGCAFMCSHQISLHSTIVMNFSFRKTLFQFTGEVLDRSDFTNTRADWNYKYRVRWIETSEKAVDVLVKLVFEHQKELLAAAGYRMGDRFM